MAALRHGIKTVIIPKDNERDLEVIDQTVRQALKFVVASSVDTVLDTALNRHNEVFQPVFKEIPSDMKTKSHKPVIRQ